MLSPATDNPDSPASFVLEPITGAFGIALPVACKLLFKWAYEPPSPRASYDLRSWLERRRCARDCLAVLATLYRAGPTAVTTGVHLCYGRRHASDAVRWDRLMRPA